jgi:hypothetical protein
MLLHMEDVVKFQAQLLNHISDTAIAIDTEQRITYWSQ